VLEKWFPVGKEVLKKERVVVIAAKAAIQSLCEKINCGLENQYTHAHFNCYNETLSWEDFSFKTKPFLNRGGLLP
jgi:hypothetical protein